MHSLPMERRPAGALENSVHESATLQRHVRALVVGPNIEVRRALLRTLEALSRDVIVCSTQTQAEEVLRGKQSTWSFAMSICLTDHTTS